MKKVLKRMFWILTAMATLAFTAAMEEYLYSAMEDFRIDIMIDKGPSARSIQIDLEPFEEPRRHRACGPGGTARTTAIKLKIYFRIFPK